MTDLRVLRAKSPADLLALAPSLLGFHPADSLVLITLGGARHPFHARMDLPDDPGTVAGTVDYLSSILDRHGVERVAVVAYSEDAGLAEAVVDALDARLRTVPAHTEIVCALRADGERYWVLGVDGDPDGPGAAYDVDSHPFMARAVFDGTVVHRSREQLAESLAPHDPAEMLEVEAFAQVLAEQLAESRRGVGRGRRLGMEGHWVRHRVRRFLDDGERLDACDVARLAVLVSASPDVRDVAWAEMSRESAPRHVELWQDAVRRVPGQVRATPAALLGFAAWLAGNGALAWCALDVAHQADAGHRLADLLREMLVHAVPPSTWTPIPPEQLRVFAG